MAYVIVGCPFLQVATGLQHAGNACAFSCQSGWDLALLAGLAAAPVTSLGAGARAGSHAGTPPAQAAALCQDAVQPGPGRGAGAHLHWMPLQMEVCRPRMASSPRFRKQVPGRTPSMWPRQSRGVRSASFFSLYAIMSGLRCTPQWRIGQEAPARPCPVCACLAQACIPQVHWRGTRGCAWQPCRGQTCRCSHWTLHIGLAVAADSGSRGAPCPHVPAGSCGACTRPGRAARMHRMQHRP